MAKSAKFLTTLYGGYFHREVPGEDAELTRVGPGTPGGEYLRRAWQPIALSSELKDLPVAVRILGEDLVLFQDLSGRTGLLELHCSHRGTSLEFGIVSERGIRCCYHSWLFDVDGRILETPGEPPESTLKDRLCHGAYPTLEYNGLVFAYLGPPDKRPDFPIYDTYDIPDNRLVPYSLVWACNWVQIIENGMDPAHTVFLHTKISYSHFSPAWGELPVMEWRETPLGMIYITTRRCGDLVWVRSNDIILPNLTQAGAIWEDAAQEKIFTRAGLTRWTTPIDDTHTLIIGWRHFNDAVDPYHKGNEQECGKGTVDFFGQTGDRPYEERQRIPEDYDAQVSQRPIAVHALEHLGTTDRGVTMFRKIVRRGIRAVKRAAEPTPLGATLVPTYAHDTVVRVPTPATGDDRELLRDIGREVTKIVVEGEYHVGGDRQAEIERRVCALASRRTGAAGG